MRYQASGLSSAQSSSARLAVGPFSDDRETDGDWLGAIRGGYGNPLKKLRTTQPVHATVEEVFRDALRSRGRLAQTTETDLEIRGSIQKLDCSYYFNREVHAHLRVGVFHIQSGAELYSNEYCEDRTEGGVGAGIFGSVDGLRGLAESTLNGAVDKVFADPRIWDSLTADVPSASNQKERLRDRLEQLESLHEDGFLTDDEYREKREEILRDL